VSVRTAELSPLPAQAGADPGPGGRVKQVSAGAPDHECITQPPSILIV
jgi:hypothetical protein